MDDYSVLGTMMVMLQEWPVGTLLAITMLLSAVVIVSIVAWGLFTAVDSWFQTKKYANGIVVSKYYRPAHTQVILIYSPATKTSMPHLVPLPEQWMVSVEVDGVVGCTAISLQDYDAVSEGTEVIAEYVSGRLTGGFYLKGISRV